MTPTLPQHGVLFVQQPSTVNLTRTSHDRNPVVPNNKIFSISPTSISRTDRFLTIFLPSPSPLEQVIYNNRYHDPNPGFDLLTPRSCYSAPGLNNTTVPATCPCSSLRSFHARWEPTSVVSHILTNYDLKLRCQGSYNRF